MKKLALACLLALSPIPGIVPERPRIVARLGERRGGAVLYWASMGLDRDITQ